MNFLSIFVLIPLLMLAGLWAARGIKAIRGVMVTGASALLIASVVLTFLYLGERSAGNTAEMLFRADTLWYAPLHISYSVGVDGISVAMLLLSAVIVFTGTFASWRLQPLTKEYSHRQQGEPEEIFFRQRLQAPGSECTGEYDDSRQ